MTDATTTPGQAPAGWYPVEGQQDRYWTGSEWTDQVRPTTTAVAPQGAAHVSPATPASGATKRAWYRRGWVIGVAAFLVGIMLGSAGASGADPKDTPEYQAVAADLADTQEQLETAEADLAAAEQGLEEVAGDLPAREEAVETAEADLKAREDAVAKAEAAVAKAEAAVLRREKAVGIVEKTVARNTISGEGMYEAGVDIKPGTYKTSGATGCYYAVLNSPDTFDIVSNNNIDGPGIVRVAAGQYLMLSGCADWVLQR